jgi:hypothetical protein
VQEQRFWQERLGTRDVDELGIDTNASFLADAVQPLPPAPPAPAPPPVYAAAPAGKPQKGGMPAAAPSKAPPKEKEGGTPIIIVPSGCALLEPSVHPPYSQLTRTDLSLMRRRLGAQVLLNMFNAQPFFEDCAFVPWEQRKSVRACVGALSRACAWKLALHGWQHVTLVLLFRAGGRAQRGDA